MKIAVIQASSQKQKNELLCACVKKAVKGQGHEIINFGVFPEEKAEYSYIQTSLLVGLLLAGGAVDFVVTGCSSGQGMMLACNSMPGVLCGYVQNPADAYLFGRINDGNAVSLPLGLQFGWAGEINLQSTLDSLFGEPFGIGYPPEDAERKIRDTGQLKAMRAASQKSFAEFWKSLDEELVKSVMQRECVWEYVRKYGNDFFL